MKEAKENMGTAAPDLNKLDNSNKYNPDSWK